MTKKAFRRKIMVEVGYTEKRIQYLGDDGTWVYRRGGDLLKVELRKVLEALGVSEATYSSSHKRAHRGYIRDAVGIEYDSQMGWDRFTKWELRQIHEEVSG